MATPDFLLGTHLRLARVSHQRGQVIPRNKFLILAGAAACQAGFLRVAERCREVVLRNNSKHLLGQTRTFPDALRDDDFQSYLKQLIKFCSPERAELLLAGLGQSSDLLTEADALEILNEM